MTSIDRVGRAPPSRPPARLGNPGPSAGFAAPSPAADPPPPSGLAAAAPVALEGLLALQQVDDATGQDRAARRQGLALIGALGRLQRRLLECADPAAILTEIKELAESMPVAIDPGLTAAVGQVVLRARIELARREHVRSG